MSQQFTPQFQPQGPGAYASPPAQPLPPGASSPQGQPVGPGQEQPRPRKARNVVAIVAFIAAIAGFVFAVTEGAFILGWVLLPIAFILSLVALFQRDQPKRMAVAALILAIVGTIAGVMAFLSSAARAFDDAFSGGEVTAAPAQPGNAAPADGGRGQADVGTRGNPYPLGTALFNEDWQVTVNSVDLNAASKVAAVNGFNEKPDAGHTYALVNVTVTYVGETSGTPSEIGVAYVTNSGNTVNSFDKVAVAPDALESNELYTGASATGNVALHIPKDDEGLLRVRPGFLADEVFVAIR